MRYEVAPSYWNYGGTLFDVIRIAPETSPRPSVIVAEAPRAEAEIMAFALNTIAEGDKLVKDFSKDDEYFDWEKCEYYTGPTDGVAP